jgi:hypothetical protein
VTSAETSTLREWTSNARAQVSETAQDGPPNPSPTLRMATSLSTSWAPLNASASRLTSARRSIAEGVMS